MNLVLSLTEQCNLRCSYCYYKESQSGRSLVMETSTMEAAIELCLERTLLFKQKFMHITFFGGEPLIRKEAIFYGVSFAKNAVARAIGQGKASRDFSLKFAINTNGTLFDNEMLDFCEREHFRIYISLDGPSEQHDIARRTMGGNGSFDILYKHLSRLSRLDSVALCVVTRKHVPHLADSVKWIHQQGFRCVTTSVDFEGRWTDEDFEALSIQYQKMANYWLECRRNRDSFVLGTIQDKFRLRLRNIRYRDYSCHVYRGAIGVATNGNIFPCTRFITSSDNPPYLQGNVFEGFDEDACGKIREFLEMDKKECVDCAIRHRCVAHECACTAFYSTGSIYEVSSEVCTHERMLTKICDSLIEKMK